MTTNEHKELNKFAGYWHTEGIIPAANTVPEIKISGTDTYEWLPGRFFLLHKVDVFVGDDKNETVEIFGFNTQSGKYTLQHYDNKGRSGFMTATCDEGVWTFLGETLRFTGSFKNEDKEFSGIWEQTTDGKSWAHFMNIKLTRSDNAIETILKRADNNGEETPGDKKLSEEFREKELLQVERDWNKAIEQNNVEEIGSFMSDDWVIVGTGGGITSKNEFLGWIRSGDLSHSRMDADETRVRVYGDTGVVTSRGTSGGKYKGQNFELYEWSTSTFFYRNGRWICVHSMLTPANKQ